MSEAPAAGFEEILADSPEPVRQVATAVRALVHEVCPGAVEVVWPRQRSVGWGLGPRKMTEQFAYLMPHARHVTLGFYYGGELDDPAGLLRGGGRQAGGRMSMRSLRLTDVEEVANPELRDLAEAAVEQLRAQLDR